MGWISGLDQNTAPVHSDEVDHVGAKFSQLVAQLMNQMMLLAQKAIAQQRLDAERARNQDEAAERAHKAAVAAERKAVEGRVTKLAERGWELATRADIVEAVRDATTHAANSPILQRALAGLIEHVHGRYGVHLDVQNGYVTVDAPGMSGQLAVAEQGRTAAARVRTAQDRMVSEVAAEAIPESVKEQLYKDISDWQRNPSGHSLHNLTKKLETAGVTAKARTKVRFIAVYLGTPGVELPPYELGAAVAASPTAELRKLGEPLVDPAEEAKFRVDTLLTDYQSRLRSGLDTDGVQERLREEVKVLTPEDQALARTQGTRIRANPAAQVKPLFPGYVDRVQLAEAVRSYAVLAPQIEIRQLVDHETDADWFGQQRKRAHGLRQQIDQAIKSGKGLHPLEVDQLKAVLTDIEAGKIETPALLFVDDRSAAAVDTERSDQIARQAATAHRHKLEEILEHGAGVPNGVVRRAHNEIANLADANTGLAGGRMTLGDFEFRAADSKMLTKLEALGVPEPTRNQVRKEMVRAVEDSATTGKQARRIADRWTERRDLVVAGRAAKPAFDGPQRRADLANDLRAAGLDEDSIAQRLAASTGRARPIGAAVNEGPGSNGRTTTPGAGVQRTHHRGKGRGNGHDKGLGL